MGGLHVVVVVSLAVVVVVGFAVVVVEDAVVVVVASVEVVVEASVVVVVEVSVVVVEGASVVVVVSTARAGAAATHQNMPTPSTSAKMSMAGERRVSGVGRARRLRADAARLGLPRRIRRRLKRCSRPISPNTTLPRFLPLYRQGDAKTFAIPAAQRRKKHAVRHSILRLGLAGGPGGMGAGMRRVILVAILALFGVVRSVC